jgi:hypothetical protein
MAMANTLRRDPYWFDRVLENITATFDLENPDHVIGARVVVTGTDVAVYVVIPDTVVRFKARQRRADSYDRTTSLINVVEALAADDLDQMGPVCPDEIDPELAQLDLPPTHGWCTHPPWPGEMIDAAMNEMVRLIMRTLDDVNRLADGLDEHAHGDAIDGAFDDRFGIALQAPASYIRGDRGLLLVPARLVFSAQILGLPTRAWQSWDHGRWQMLSVEGIDLCIATTRPTWIVERAS